MQWVHGIRRIEITHEIHIFEGGIDVTDSILGGTRLHPGSIVRALSWLEG